MLSRGLICAGSSGVPNDTPGPHGPTPAAPATSSDHSQCGQASSVSTIVRIIRIPVSGSIRRRPRSLASRCDPSSIRGSPVGCAGGHPSYIPGSGSGPSARRAPSFASMYARASVAAHSAIHPCSETHAGVLPGVIS